MRVAACLEARGLEKSAISELLTLAEFFDQQHTRSANQIRIAEREVWLAGVSIHTDVSDSLFRERENLEQRTRYVKETDIIPRQRLSFARSSLSSHSVLRFVTQVGFARARRSQKPGLVQSGGDKKPAICASAPKANSRGLVRISGRFGRQAGTLTRPVSS